MPNPNLAQGLTPVRYRSGAPYNGAANIYHVPATDGTALFLGDPVIHVTDASDTFDWRNLHLLGGHQLPGGVLRCGSCLSSGSGASSVTMLHAAMTTAIRRYIVSYE